MLLLILICGDTTDCMKKKRADKMQTLPQKSVQGGQTAGVQ